MDRQLSGVSVADLRDEEGPWPATGPGSSSGSAATARSRAGGCDGEGRVGVRGQRSGSCAVLLNCGWSRGLGRATWAPRRGTWAPRRCEWLWVGGRQWGRGVCEVTVAAPRGEEDEELPLNVSRAWQFLFRETPWLPGEAGRN